MDQNPYESPEAVGYSPVRPRRLPRALLAIGIACCLVSWSPYLFFVFGPLNTGMDDWDLGVYLQTTRLARVIGPVFTGIAMWNGTIAIRAWGALVLLVQAPLTISQICSVFWR